MANIMRALLGGGEPAKPTLSPAMEEIRRHVQEALMKIDGTILVGDRAFLGLDQLDDHREQLAGGKHTLHVVFAEVEAECVAQIKQIQRSLFSQLGLPS